MAGMNSSSQLNSRLKQQLNSASLKWHATWSDFTTQAFLAALRSRCKYLMIPYLKWAQNSHGSKLGGKFTRLQGFEQLKAFTGPELFLQNQNWKEKNKHRTQFNILHWIWSTTKRKSLLLVQTCILRFSTELKEFTMGVKVNTWTKHNTAKLVRLWVNWPDANITDLGTVAQCTKLSFGNPYKSKIRGESHCWQQMCPSL